MAEKSRNTNPDSRQKYISRLREARNKSKGIDRLKDLILKRERYALSEAITLVESKEQSDTREVTALVEWAAAQKRISKRIAIIGSPGVGKSSFIEQLGKGLLKAGKTLAVLAVDPTSKVSKGSILGDKTRMEELVKNDNVFIRPSPAGTSLGGVSRNSREAILLCEAAGFDYIIVETVGVGQSESLVHSMVDLFMLLLQPGEGDELQGIKRGIVELADILIVTKSDEGRENLAKQTLREYKIASHISGAKAAKWDRQFFHNSIHDKATGKAILDAVFGFFKYMENENKLGLLRKSQELFWFDQLWNNQLFEHLQTVSWFSDRLRDLQKSINSGSTNAISAAQSLVDLVIKKMKSE